MKRWDTTDLNKMFTHSFGYTLEDIPTLERWWNLAYPSGQLAELVKSEWLHGIREAQEAGKELTPVDREVRCKDGAIRVVEFRKTVIDKWVIHILHDVTETRLQEEMLRESEERHRAIFENASIGIDICDEKGFFRVANPTLLKMLGYTLDEMAELTNLDVTHPEDIEISRRNLEDLLRGFINNYTIEKRFVRKDGTTMWGNLSVSGIKDSDGICRKVVGVIEDTTRRKEEQEARRKSEEMFRMLVDESPLAMAITTGVHEKIEYLNAKFTELFGYTIEDCHDVYRWTLLAYPHEDYRTRLLSEWQQRVETAMRDKTAIEPMEAEVTCRDGSKKTIEWGLVSVGARNVAFGVDLTSRRRAEEALRESENRYRRISAIMSDVAYSCTKTPSTAYSIDWIAGATERLVGYTTEELKKMRCWRNIVVEEDLPIFDMNVTGIPPNTSLSCELRMRRKSGEEIWVSSFVECATDPVAPDGLRLYGGLLDITERKEAEETLRKDEERFRIVADFAHDWEYWIDTKGTFVYMSPSCERITGYSRENFLDSPSLFETIVHSDDQELVREHMKASSKGDLPDTCLLEFRIIDSTGKIHWIEHVCRNVVGTTPLGRRASQRDVTDRKRAEEERESLRGQLFQSQKMQAVGTLAAGIAHDFNNMLQVILGYADLLLLDKKKGQPGYAELQKIIKTSQDARDLVQKIRVVSGRVDIESVPLDLNAHVEDAAKLLKHTLPETIRIDIHLAKDLEIIDADAALIDQMIMNLAVNAGEAMTDGGTVIIKTENIVLDDDFCQQRLGLQTGPHVLLTVSDTGRGIEKEHLDRLFDPFYSTKTRDYHKGTGLGLPLVKGIVEQTKGYIDVETKVGRGTTFRIYLPVLETAKAPKTVEELSLPAGGTETILLVEDEEIVRDLGVNILEQSGYKVLAVVDGQEAVDVYEREKDSIALVILDIIMPRMDGAECLRELLRMNPGVKVLVSTGVVEDDLIQDVVSLGAKGSLKKPFNVDALLQKVRQVLDLG